MTPEEERAVTCCFTGHRPEKMPFAVTKYGYDFYKFNKALEASVQKAYLEGYRVFITGMSRGMDLWAAGYVLDFKRAYPDIRLEAAVPCPGMELRWSPDERREYTRILNFCDSRKIVSAEYDRGCMQRRNRYMADRSSLLIAAYSGSPGGTKYTVEYAEKQGLRIVNILSAEGEQINI